MRVSSTIWFLLGTMVAFSESSHVLADEEGKQVALQEDPTTTTQEATTTTTGELPSLGPGWSSIFTMLCLVLAGPLFVYIKGLIGGEAEAEARAGFRVRREISIKGKEREESSFTGYIFGLLGYAIGVANVWRFPYVVGENGGGAFVIAYLVALMFVSLPMFFNELALGHYTRKSTIDAFRWIHRRWVGLGYAQVLLVFLISINFNVVIAWALTYLASTMVYPLPWDESRGGAVAYWHDVVLNEFPNTTGISDDFPERIPSSPQYGPVQWHLAVALAVVHILNFCAIAFGKETLEKVTIVTVVAPLVMMVVLLIQAVQLDGAMDGIRFYILRIEWERLYSVAHWRRACSQILFSLGPGFSTGVTSSSATAENANVYTTALIVGFANSGFSILGGFAIFSILGNVAYRNTLDARLLNPNATQVEVAEVATSGPGLAFIAIAEGMKTFGWLEPVMATLFFAMLATLGLASSFAWIDTVTTVVQDFCRSLGLVTNKLVITGTICFSLWLSGLLYCCRAGLALHTSTWNYIGGTFLLFGVSLEAILLFFGFGWEKVQMSIKKATATEENPEGATIHLGPLFMCAMKTTMPLAPWGLLLYTAYEEIVTEDFDLPLWIRWYGYGGFIFLSLVSFSTLWMSDEPKSDEMEMGKEALAPEAAGTSFA